jgi:hypothetical protein
LRGRNRAGRNGGAAVAPCDGIVRRQPNRRIIVGDEAGAENARRLGSFLDDHSPPMLWKAGTRSAHAGAARNSSILTELSIIA